MVQDALARGEALAGAWGTAERSPEQSIPLKKGVARPPGKEELVELLRKHRGIVTEVARAVGRSRKQAWPVGAVPWDRPGCISGRGSRQPHPTQALTRLGFPSPFLRRGGLTFPLLCSSPRWTAYTPAY